MKAYHIFLLGLSLCMTLGCEDVERPGAGGQFIRVYGTEGADVAHALVETSDGGFAIAGKQEVAGKQDEMLLIRTDADGTVLWTKTFGGTGNDSAEDLLLLSDGGFLLVGTTRSSTDDDAWVLRTDAEGDSIWAVSMDDGGRDDQAFAAHLLDDGSFAISGSSESADSLSSSQLTLAHVLSDGTVSWQRSYGGDAYAQGFGLDIAPNGDWVVCGSKYDDANDYEMYVLRVTTDGDSLWEYTWGTTKQDNGRAIFALDDGTIAVAGHTGIGTENSDIMVRLLASDGNEVVGDTWSIGGGDAEELYCKHFFQRADGSFVIAATTQSKGEGASDFYLLAAATDKSLKIDQAFGGSNDDVATAVIETSDGRYAMAGYSKSFQFGDDYDIVLLKTTQHGDLVVE